MLTAEVYSFTIRIDGIDVHIVLLRTCVLYMHKFTEFGVTIDTVWNGMVCYGEEQYCMVRFGVVLYGTVWCDTADVTIYTA